MAEAHRDEIAKLEALYASNPEGRVFTHLAEVYRKSGELDKARQILNDGIRRHPDSASAFVVLGRVLSDSGDNTAGFDAFRRALELDTGNLVALRWCGDLAMRAGRVDDALGYYHELIARDPSNSDLRERVAVIENDRDAAMSITAASRDAGAATVETPATAAARAPSPPDELHFEPTDLSGGFGTPSGGEEYDPADLPGDLAAFAGKQIESRTGKSWMPQATDAETALQAEDDLMFAGPDAGAAADESADAPLDLDAFVLDGLEAGSGVETPADASEEFGSFDLAGDEPVDVFAGSADLDMQPAGQANPVIQPDDALYGSNPSEVDASDFSEFEAPSGTVTGNEPVEEEDVEEPAPATFEAEPAGEPELPPVWMPDTGMEATAEPGMESAEPEPTEVAEAAFASEPAWEPEPEPAWEPVPEPVQQTEPEPATFVAPAAPEPAAPVAAWEPPASVGGSGLVTETMAELYRNQGFPDRAADVYRQLIRERGGDARVERMLAELEGAGSNAGPQEDLVLDQDTAGEMWLKEEETPWTSSEPGGAEHSSPYALEHEGDDTASAVPIASYFASLLQWRGSAGPGQVSAATTVMFDTSNDGAAEAYDEVLLLDESDESADEDTPELPMLATGTEPFVDRVPPATTPVPPAAPVMPAAPATPAAELMPWESAEPAAVAEPAPVAAPMPVAAPAPTATPAAPAVHHDPMPWDLPAEPAAPAPATAPTAPAPQPAAPAAPASSPPAAAEELMPWETAPAAAMSAPEAASGSAASPDASVAAPWNAADAMSAASAEDDSASAANGATGSYDEWYSGEAGGGGQDATQAGDASEGEDDEDLEMFRSWLQSLKK